MSPGSLQGMGREGPRRGCGTEWLEGGEGKRNRELWGDWGRPYLWAFASPPAWKGHCFLLPSATEMGGAEEVLLLKAWIMLGLCVCAPKWVCVYTCVHEHVQVHTVMWSPETRPLAWRSCSRWTPGVVDMVAREVATAQEWQAGGWGPADSGDLGQVTPLSEPQSPHLAKWDENHPWSLVGWGSKKFRDLQGLYNISLH